MTLNSKTHQLSDIPKMEFLHDISAVGLDRFDAEHQSVGNLLVSVPFGNELEHFQFAWRESERLKEIFFALVHGENQNVVGG